jgi:hypothetical protein
MTRPHVAITRSALALVAGFVFTHGASAQLPSASSA